MKETLRYAVVLLVFIWIAYGLSWLSVFAFWYAAHAFHSVPAVRFCDALGSIVLIPVRVLFWCFHDFFDQTAPLTDPGSYAALNGVLLGSLVYGCCRRLIFRQRTGDPKS